ncbi:hypothetical protein Tco_1075607 [Tanacetum coccineum]
MRYKLNKNYAEKLKLTADNNKITLSLKAGGKVQFWYNGRMISKQHFKVWCDFIEQSKLHLGVAHYCTVNLGYLRPLMKFSGSLTEWYSALYSLSSKLKDTIRE